MGNIKCVRDGLLLMYYHTARGACMKGTKGHASQVVWLRTALDTKSQKRGGLLVGAFSSQ